MAQTVFRTFLREGMKPRGETCIVKGAKGIKEKEKEMFSGVSFL